MHYRIYTYVLLDLHTYMHRYRISLSSRERAQRAISRLEAAGVGFVPCGAFHIPLTDYSDVEEECRSYVYPACGHIHGYHRSLEDRCCPLCRMSGPFVPIAFSFESAICNKKPTHVFNPCGHVASKQTCEKWSRLLIFDYTPAQLDCCRSQCPFCAK